MGTVYAKEPRKYSPLGSIPCETKENSAKEIQLDGIPARVDRIKIDGLVRTKDDVVEASVKELFKAQDFQDVIMKAHKVRGHLDSLGCFKSIGIFIDTSKGPGATPEGLEVTFHVKELKRIVGGINTMVGNNEGSLVVGLRLPNIWGRGERIQAEYSYGNKRTANVNLAIIKPFVGCVHEPVLTLSGFQQASEWPWSGYCTVDKGTLLDVAFCTTPFAKHNLQWEGSIREMYTLSKNSAFEVREQSGPRLRSILRHIYSIDKRDDRVFPSSGCLFQWTTELAGLGGSIGHIKNDFHMQLSRPIVPNIILQGTLQGGILYPIEAFGPTDMGDNYYIGGPLSVRGFNTRGIGPASDGNFIGSEMFWAAGLQLFGPLPFRPGQGGLGDLFRVHGFLNAGNMGTFDISLDLENTWASLSETMRLSTGLGLAMRIGQIARVELNYCFPLQTQDTDSTCPGIQFGIGLKFL